MVCYKCCKYKYMVWYAKNAVNLYENFTSLELIWLIFRIKINYKFKSLSENYTTKYDEKIIF